MDYAKVARKIGKSGKIRTTRRPFQSSSDAAAIALRSSSGRVVILAESCFPHYESTGHYPLRTGIYVQDTPNETSVK